MLGTRHAPTASPTRSMRSPWPEPRGGNRACPGRASMGPRGICGCSWIIAKTWSGSERRRSTGCAGILHELDPSWDPAPRLLVRFKHLDALGARLDGLGGTVAWVARDLVARIRELTVAANELERRIVEQVSRLAPALLGLAGVGGLTAA